ncbi:glycosyl hydrolase family 5 [Breoghania sp.]|uniref:glycosyl hydrolase family 5 n=1 Tax=Breoghania sp. TaxID=2065378 RepID=UPI002AA6D4BB|nr:glycosyl hydrolase family 5 [Breoghania sp.]
MKTETKSISRRGLLQSGAVAVAAATLGGQGEALAQEGDYIVEGRDLRKDKRPVIHADGTKFGAYDPYGDFSDDSRLVTEHLFLPWEDVELGGLSEADAYAQARNRKILVTIEPWSWAIDWNVSPGDLRNQILGGERDANMRAILDILKGFKSPVTIRWGQEMENPFNRFTWAGWAPDDYITAYRRMTGIVREMMPSAKMMWSPRGEKNLQDYYPGDEYADLIGLTVLGFDKYDEIAYGGPRYFAEGVKQGYELSAGYGKPIWIPDGAYEGALPYLDRWVKEFTVKYPEYPLLEEVIYFNDKEVWEWPHGLGLPDWRVVRGRPNYPVRGR